MTYSNNHSIDMSAEKIDNLEKQFSELQKIVYKIEASLGNIEKHISSAISLRDTVTTHTEKHKVSENRVSQLEESQKKQSEAISSINLKIALVTGAWGVIFF
jgi:predicted RNase H-like nuclease (RuvC/YqgF family)